MPTTVVPMVVPMFFPMVIVVPIMVIPMVLMMALVMALAITIGTSFVADLLLFKPFALSSTLLQRLWAHSVATAVTFSSNAFPVAFQFHLHFFCKVLARRHGTFHMALMVMVACHVACLDLFKLLALFLNVLPWLRAILMACFVRPTFCMAHFHVVPHLVLLRTKIMVLVP